MMLFNSIFEEINKIPPNLPFIKGGTLNVWQKARLNK